MKRNPTKGVIFKSGITLIVVLAVFVIHSCRKDLKEADDAGLNPAVLQAKNWYEGAYPQIAGGNNSSPFTQQNVKPTQGTIDLSQIIKPDWQRNVSYNRFDKDVIEIPIDQASKYNFGLKNDLRIFNKAYSRTSFLIFKNGSKYDAYVMMIIADSAYLKNDLSKLANNTFRKHDADFTGAVLYFTPKGKFLRSYGYKDGKLLPPANAEESTNGTKQTQAVKTNNNEVPYAYCLNWYVFHYENDVLVGMDFLYTECFQPNGGDGGGGGGGTSTPPPPPPCPPTTHAIRGKVVNGEHAPPTGDPGPGGDPGFPDPTTTDVPCPVVVVTDTTVTSTAFKVKFCDGLTAEQKTTLQATIDNFKTQDCISKYLTAYSKDKTFNFCINNSGNTTGNATYVSGTITFNSDYVAGRVDVFSHEFFHGFQDAVYGGTSQYGSGSPGFANIEFETALFTDIEYGTTNAFDMGTDDQRKRYTDWINSITINRTAYPKLTTGTSAYNQFMSDYNSYLNEFNNIPNNPYHSNLINLSPNSLIQIFNNTNPNCQ